MRSKQTKVTEIVFVIGITMLFLTFLGFQYAHRDSFSPLNYEVTCLEQPATLILEDGTSMPIAGEDAYFHYDEAKPDELLTIVMQLPEIDDKDRCITIFSTEQNIGIYIDGEERAYYNDEQYRLAGSYSASRFVTVSVGPQDSGKELRVTYQTSIATYAGVLSCPKYATIQDMLYWIYFRYIGQIAAALLLFAVGVIFIIFDTVLRLKKRADKGIGYLGIFSIVIAAWLTCQSNMRVFYSSYLSSVNLMALYMVMIAPAPIILFFNILMKYQYQKHFTILVSVAMANTALCIVLEFAGIADVINLLPVTHTIIIACCGLCLLDFCRYMKDGEITEPKAIIIGMVGFFFTVILEEANLLFLDWFFVGKYLGYGTLFLMILLGYAAFRSSEEQEREYLEAVRASQVKSSFLGNMSHEIRTPISTIMGMNEMILNESNERMVINYAQNIRNAGNILLSLVNDILDFTKIEAGRMEIVPARYELRNVLNDLLQAVGSRATLKGLGIRLDVERSTPNVLYGDELRIRQAVTNLLTNAVKYTQKGGITLKIRYVKLSEDEIRLYISVEDTGIGIRSEDQQRLFESFVRLDENRNRSVEGTGLGLAITSSIVSAMQGKIELHSEYGKGSAFTISLVQKVLDHEPVGDFEDWYVYMVRRPKQYLNQYDASDVRLLVVDDNEMNLEVIKGLLKKTGAAIDAAASGRECLELVKQKEYDLILMDHMMPEMNGIDTFKKLQEQRPKGAKNIPVVALTANAVSGAREEYLKLGFADYIAKPVEYRKLIEVMKKFLPDRVRLRAEAADEQLSGEEYLEQKGIHVQAALKYTAGDFDQYVHLLELFTSDRDRTKQKLLAEAYAEYNWKNYVTYVHGLKNCARMIGADELADMAYEHECRGKEHDKKYIRQSFDALLDIWNQTEDVIRGWLERTTDRKEAAQDAGPDEAEWTQQIDKVVQYLDVFQKKEALEVLEGLAQCRLKPWQEQLVGETIQAVKSYDYERAILILTKRE